MTTSQTETLKRPTSDLVAKVPHDSGARRRFKKKKTPKHTQMSDKGWEAEQRGVILTDKLIQKEEAGRKIS